MKVMFSVAVAVLFVLTPAASAAVVDVRVEGRTQTLFEGPVRSAGAPVRAASDAQQRHCDGTNNRQHPTSGATATGAATEGLRLNGLDFDARWFPGFDDYYITRFGPDAEDLNAQTFWGVLVDDVFTDVGGCQAQVTDGQRVLWAYDAFNDREFLKLAAPGGATVVAGQPLTVVVTRGAGGPGGTFTAAGGVAVAPVVTAVNGVQTVQGGGVTTASDGTADLVFNATGWQRVKADGGPSGPIRSNRLDVCVVAAPGGSCGAPPFDTQVREAAPLPPDPVAPPTGDTGAGKGTGGGGGGTGALQGAPVIELPRFTSTGRKSGRVGVRWRVLQKGVGIKRWRFVAHAAGSKGKYTAIATGTRGTTALLRLGAGRTWTVRVTFTDTLGRDVTQAIGDVLVPLDTGALAVRRSGRWTRHTDAGAWRGATHRGAAGAVLSARVAAGRPVVLVRGVRATAEVEVRIGSRPAAVYRIAGSATTATREVVLPRRARAGTLRVRVVRGVVGVDGVGVRP